MADSCEHGNEHSGSTKASFFSSSAITSFPGRLLLHEVCKFLIKFKPKIELSNYNGEF
jgi:hypothetical protein